MCFSLLGYGKSPINKDFTLQDFIAEVQLDRPAVVSPSGSGGHSIPFVFSDPQTWEDRARAYIALAPVNTNEIEAKKYKRCHVSACKRSNFNI